MSRSSPGAYALGSYNNHAYEACSLRSRLEYTSHSYTHSYAPVPAICLLRAAYPCRGGDSPVRLHPSEEARGYKGLPVRIAGCAARWLVQLFRIILTSDSLARYRRLSFRLVRSALLEAGNVRSLLPPRTCSPSLSPPTVSPYPRKAPQLVRS